MIRVADYVIEKLKCIGIKDVFLITGRGILYLSDAVAKCKEINSISMHHEQSCAYAAYAYAQKKKSMGACIVSTGCGSTNAITGCLCAWQDEVPCIFISGQNILNETTNYTGLNIRTYGEQEANIVDIVKPITKYAVMIKEPKDIVYEMNKAISIANSGRKGPVWIDIPLDIQNGRLEDVCFETTENISIKRCNKEDAKRVAEMIDSSYRPVVLMGSGIASAGADKVLFDYIEKYDIPVVFDSATVDLYADENRLSIGTVGAMGGSRAGNFVIQNADLVLSIGCKLTAMQVGNNPDHFARDAKIIVVDIDAEEIKKRTVNIDFFIETDVRDFITILSGFSLNKKFDNWSKKCLEWKNIFPKCDEDRKIGECIDLYYLADVIGNCAAEGDTIISDAGIEELVVPSVVCKKQGVRCIHPASQGAMGFALPAMVGSNVADKNKARTISVIGDGSIMMNLQELQTVSYLKLNSKIFVINNNCYAVIRRRQKDLFRNRTIGTDYNNGVSCPDFKKIAYAFGIDYYKIDNPMNLKEDVDIVLNHEGPILCEVMGYENQTYLHNSFTINDERKMVRRSLEDQSPFLDRDLIKQQMIVDYLG